MSRRLGRLAVGVCLGLLGMAAVTRAQSPGRAVNRPVAVNGLYDIVPPADKQVSLDLGDVTVTTFSPVTVTPVENSTDLYFVATNRAASQRRLQFTSYAEILSTQPSWMAHFFKFTGLASGPGSTADTLLAAGETKTIRFYASKESGDARQQADLPFRFKVAETNAQGTLSITIIGEDNTQDFNRVHTAVISGRVTAAGQPVAGALITAALVNDNVAQRARTDADGNYRLDVTSIDDIRTVMGPRPFAYRSIDYFLTADADGYALSYRAGLSPAKGQTIVADISLQPVPQRSAYTPIGQIATDGKLSYWWTRFAGTNNDRIVAVQGQHPPVAPGVPGHIIAIDLTGKELWRVPTGGNCWGFDVAPGGQLIAAGCDDAYVYIVQADGVIKHKLRLGDRPGGGFVDDVHFSPDGSALIIDAGGGAGGFSILNVQSGQIVWNSRASAGSNDTQGAYKSRWSADGNRYVAGSGGPLAMYTAAGAEVWRTTIGESALWLEIDDAYNVYAGGKSRTLFAFDPNGNLRWSFRLAHTTNAAAKGMSSDASLLVLPTFNGLLQTFDAAGQQLWQRFLPIQPDVTPQGFIVDRVFGPGHNALSMTPTGNIIAIGTRGYQLVVYDRSGSLLWSDKASARADFTGAAPAYPGANSVAVSPDGKYIAAGYSDSVIRIFRATVPPPAMSLDRAALNFSATSNGSAFVAQTAAQQVRLTQSGSGAVTWTATSNQPWLTVTPSSGSGSAVLTIGTKFVAGLPATSTGRVTITLTGAATATAGPITASLSVLSSTTSASPIGSFDTPADGTSGLSGSIAVTGWALDDVEVTDVQIWRDPNPADPPGATFGGGAPQGGKVFVGLASFVEGARPDVQTGNPASPLNSRAGWGYLMLTRGLIWDGKGPFKLYAIAQDREGHLVQLGSKTISIANASATTPFGAIDTPGQGATASGMYPNTGWVLTPNAGATIPAANVQVAVDGVFLGGVPSVSDRADISAGFPAFTTSGAGRGFFVDTTQFANGAHTIGWLVTDSTGKADGIGSRFFTVANSAMTAGEITRTPPGDVDALRAADASVRGRRGFDRDVPFDALTLTSDGHPVLHAEELDRMEVRLDEGTTDLYVGYLRVGGRLRPLPIGSHLAGSTFTWQPGPGFLGAYDLVFVRERDGAAVARQELRIEIHPLGSLGRRGAFIQP